MESSPRSKIAAFELQHPAAAALIRSLLAPGERVTVLTTGWRSRFVDDVFLGLPTLLCNRTLVVGTDRRVLLVRCGGRALEPRGYLSEIPRAAIVAALAVPFLSVFTTRETVRLLGVPGAGKRSLAQPPDPSHKPVGTPAHLCPACFVAHPSYVSRCAGCGTAFRTPMAAAARSLVAPGWGEAYLDCPGLGALTAATTAFLWVNVIVFVRAASHVTGSRAESVGDLATGFLAAAVLAHVLAASVSWVRGHKGLIALTGALPASRPG